MNIFMITKSVICIKAVQNLSNFFMPEKIYSNLSLGWIWKHIYFHFKFLYLLKTSKFNRDFDFGTDSQSKIDFILKVKWISFVKISIIFIEIECQKYLRMSDKYIFSDEYLLIFSSIYSRKTWMCEIIFRFIAFDDRCEK